MVLEVLMVPKAGLEPARISTVDFESTASTDFATPARKGMRKTLWIIPVTRHHASVSHLPHRQVSKKTSTLTQNP